MSHSIRSFSQRQTFVSPAYQKMAFSRSKQQAPVNSNLLGSQLREVRHMKLNNSLTIKKNQVVGNPTTYNRISLAEKRQLLGSIQNYIHTGNRAYLNSVSDKKKVLKGLQSLGSIASALKKWTYLVKKNRLKLKPTS